MSNERMAWLRHVEPELMECAIASALALAYMPLWEDQGKIA
jgi:hypothetical protein